MVDFNAILAKKASDVKPPPLMPVGTYVVVATGQPQTGESSAKKTPWIGWDAKFVSPMDDVDREQLAEIGGLEGKSLKAGKQGGLTFYITEASEFMFVQFMEETCLIEKGDKSLMEMASEVSGKQFLVVMKHEETTRPGVYRSVIDSTMPM